MEAAGIAPSNFTLSILVKLYGRCKDLNRAFEIVEEYPTKYGFQINAHTYTCLMSTCISNNQTAKALEVFDAMKAQGCHPDAKTYSTLINGCLKSGDMEAAVRLVNATLDDGQNLDTALIEDVLFMLSRRQMADTCGVPLIARLNSLGIEVSDRARGSMSRGSDSNRSRFSQRRSGHA